MEAPTATVIGAAMTTLAAITAAVISNWKRLHERQAADDERAAAIPEGLEALIESSNWPMFFADLDRKIQKCNLHLAQLLDTPRSELEGKSGSNLVERLIQQAPKDRREEFRRRQSQLQVAYDQKRHPNSDEVEFLDTTSHPLNNLWRGKFRVSIHADRVAWKGRDVGYFVIYHAERVTKIPAAKDSEAAKT